MADREMEVQMAPLVMVDTIPIDLVVDVVVIMVPQVGVKVALQLIHIELVQIVPLPKHSEKKCRHD